MGYEKAQQPLDTSPRPKPVRIVVHSLDKSGNAVEQSSADTQEDMEDIPMSTLFSQIVNPQGRWGKEFTRLTIISLCMYMAPAFPHDQWMMICLITASFHCIPTKIVMTHLMVWRVLIVYTIYIIYLYSFYEQRSLNPVFINAPPRPWLKPKHSLFVLYCFNSKSFLGSREDRRITWFLYSIVL